MILTNESIKLLLNREFQLKPNDQLTRKQLEECLPGAICNEKLNTSDVVDSNSLVFEYNGIIYEYNSNCQLTWN